MCPPITKWPRDQLYPAEYTGDHEKSSRAPPGSIVDQALDTTCHLFAQSPVVSIAGSSPPSCKKNPKSQYYLLLDDEEETGFQKLSNYRMVRTVIDIMGSVQSVESNPGSRASLAARPW